MGTGTSHIHGITVACNYAVLLKENGNIVRGGKYNGNQLNGAAIGGMVQEIDPSGNVVWNTFTPMQITVNTTIFV